MLHNTTSYFPNVIDDRLFFSDLDLEHLSIFEEYKELIKNNKYTEAAKLLNNSEIDFYGSWLFNLFENQLEAIGTYLLKKPKKTQLQTYSSAEPTNVNIGRVWIGGEL